MRDGLNRYELVFHVGDGNSFEIDCWADGLARALVKGVKEVGAECFYVTEIEVVQHGAA